MGLENGTAILENSLPISKLNMRMSVLSHSVVSDSLQDPMVCSLPGSSVHEIFTARILEWIGISYSRGSSQPKDQTHVPCVSCIGRWIFYYCTIWESPDKGVGTYKVTGRAESMEVVGCC